MKVGQETQSFVKGELAAAQTEASLGGTAVTEAEILGIVERGLGLGFTKPELEQCLRWFDNYHAPGDIFVIGDHKNADLRIEPQQVTRLFQPKAGDVRPDAIQDRIVRQQMRSAANVATLAMVKADMTTNPELRSRSMLVGFMRVVDAADALMAAAERLAPGDANRGLLLGYAREMAKIASLYVTKTSEAITAHDPDGKPGESFRSTDADVGRAFDAAVLSLEYVNQRLPTLR